jgi:hypothetical protein
VSWEASLKFDHAKRRLTEGKAYKAQKVTPHAPLACTELFRDADSPLLSASVDLAVDPVPHLRHPVD